jgi:glycosyltransferase involved in cell wall biosynthesis
MSKFTIIISTWRRPKILRVLLNALCNQTVDLNIFNVLVIDSLSGDETPEVVRYFSENTKLDVQILNCPFNVLAAKRNYGMKHATGDFLIFLDDDCIPDSDHVENFSKIILQNSSDKIIWCGGVKFDRNTVKNSNYYKYRNQCHFSKMRRRIEPLKFNEIVAMNMMINRKLALRHHLYFDERFVGYGCEDIEYGWRSVENGFKILPCPADILHEELNGSIDKFKNKIFHASRDGFAILKFVAPNAISNLGMTYLLEMPDAKSSKVDNFKRFILRKILKSRLPTIIEKLLILVDGFGWLYFKFGYRFVLAAAHINGVEVRGDGSKISLSSAQSEGWYK